MYFVWDESYSVNNYPIDNQHQRLFTINNTLAENLQKGGDVTESELRKIITDLLTFARTHFAAEEKYMIRVGYPDFEKHKALHEAFETAIGVVEAELEKGDIHAVVSTLPEFVGNWLVQHIASEDQKYANFVQGSARTDTSGNRGC